MHKFREWEWEWPRGNGRDWEYWKPFPHTSIYNIRSCLTGNDTRWHSASSGGPLPQWTDFGPHSLQLDRQPQTTTLYFSVASITRYYCCSFTYPGGMEGWVGLDADYIPRQFTCHKQSAFHVVTWTWMRFWCTLLFMNICSGYFWLLLPFCTYFTLIFQCRTTLIEASTLACKKCYCCNGSCQISALSYENTFLHISFVTMNICSGYFLLLLPFCMYFTLILLSR